MADFSWDADPATAEITAPALADGGIPCMHAWVAFDWNEEAQRFSPTVANVAELDNREFVAWKRRVDAAGGFVAPVCLDASDAHDQSRALFAAHSFSPGYLDRTAALREFARLAEADWARDLLKKEGR